MPSSSKAQQRFFGVVKAMQKGDIPKKGGAGKIAKSMKKKDVDDFASTKHKGLPNKVKREQRVRELIKKMVREELQETMCFDLQTEKCWKGYTQKGMKKMFGKMYPNCVKKENVAPNHDGKAAPYGSGYKKAKKKIKEVFDLKKLEDAIKMFQKKIKKQGRITNARDEEHLKKLIKVYKEMGGRKIKEEKLTEAKESPIEVAKRIVKNKQHEKYKGMMLDLFTANAIVQVHDKVNDTMKKKLEKLPLPKLVTLVYKVMK